MKCKIIGMVVLSLMCFQAQADSWSNVHAMINTIGTSWEPNRVCVILSTGDVASIDITSDIGKTSLSIALSAKMAQKEVRIVFDNEGVLNL